jgi:ATP synthase subunit 6
MFFSPLEQFYVLPLPGWFSSLTIKNFAIFFLSNFSVMLFFVIAFFGLFIFFSSRNNGPFTYFFYLTNLIITFLVTIINENITKKGFYFFPYLFFLFFFLVTANLFGMVPYSFALTSHFAVTLFLSFLTFFSAVVIGFQQHGLKFFGLFLPNGAPFVLAPFLILVELISFLARLFSLAIRLFANIMSGHTLLKILAGFAWILGAELFSLVFLVPFVVVLVITGLEIVIAFLQAYVFTVLSSIYINEALVLH